jgi:hypothetical protein
MSHWREWWRDFWHEWTRQEQLQAVFDFFVALFTAGLLWTSYKQWWVAQRALNESNKAFVYVSKVGIEPSSLPTDAASLLTGSGEVAVTFANSGNTPARQAYFSANYWCDKIPKDFQYPDLSKLPSSYTPTFLAPKQELSVRLPIKLLSIVALRQGTAPLRIYGHVEYLDDVLGHEHRTWFCMNYRRTQQTSAGWGLDAFGACDEHNCADDDCQKPWDWKPPFAKSSCRLAASLPASMFATPTPTAKPTSTPAPSAKSRQTLRKQRRRNPLRTP